jgi:translation initiation factor IF-2
MVKKQKNKPHNSNLAQLKKLNKIKPKYSNSRIPVITLMGHVDHGKTTLLDTIRESNLVEKEYGGITQHIGAYQLEHKGRRMTFIDTPGHAAFAKMRSQGAQVTDIVVLVVAANDGVKPQTIEALSHIKAAKVPYLVAINKIDLPEANVEKVKGQLAEAGVVVESYGGDIVSVEVSAKTKKNIDQLLDMILLLSDLNQVRNNNQEFEAVVIESRQDKRKGVLATLLIKNGDLRTGDQICIGESCINVRALNDESGRIIAEAGQGMPVEVLGFKTLPEIGKMIRKVPEDNLEIQRESIKVIEKAETTSNEQSSNEEKKVSIKIILKTDVAGTLAAITGNLSDDVEIISQGVGEVNEADVLLADATKSTIYTFNTKVSSSAQRLAQIEKVKIRSFTIIYQLFEDLEKQVLKLLEPTIDEEITAKAEIIERFDIRDEQIAGCKVIEGNLKKGDLIHVVRNGETIADSSIKSLHKGKEAIEHIKSGNECGITFKPRVDFKIKDAIISYRILE